MLILHAYINGPIFACDYCGNFIDADEADKYGWNYCPVCGEPLGEENPYGR